MSNCTEELYDYDLVKKCSNCGKLLLKIKFHKRLSSKDGIFSQCKSCVIQ